MIFVCEFRLQYTKINVFLKKMSFKSLFFEYKYKIKAIKK
jgi:hypothetical protein